MLDPKNTHLISLPHDELEAMLDRAAERGALRALHDVGLDGPSAAEEIRDLRSLLKACLLYTSPSPRDQRGSRMPSSA